jgi:pyrroloquinoline quinone biosynthesis protein B
MSNPKSQRDPSSPYIMVLGVAQDAGYPQANCYRPHCLPAWADFKLRRHAACIAIIDHEQKEKYLFEATPDLKDQLYALQAVAPNNTHPLKGIFLTHGHIGHYTGLIHYGREVMGASKVPIYAMPRMREYLTNNGPWSQLVSLGNISFRALEDQQELSINPNIKVEPFLVPHRDEFTETVGFRITGPRKTAIFLPDIDKWSQWKTDIRKVIASADYAFLDATFFKDGEIPNRPMSAIPHPFVEESMKLFEDLSDKDKRKIYFIHFNHTNPLIQDGSEAQREVLENGFQIAKQGMKLPL